MTAATLVISLLSSLVASQPLLGHLSPTWASQPSFFLSSHWHLSLCLGISALVSPPVGISATAWASQPISLLSFVLLGLRASQLSASCNVGLLFVEAKLSSSHLYLIMSFLFFFFCCCCIIFISAMGICLLPCLPPFSRLFSPSPCSVEGSGGSRGPGLTMFDLTSTLPKRLGLNYAISLPPGLYTCCTSMSSLVLCLWFCTRGPSRCAWKPCVPT